MSMAEDTLERVIRCVAEVLALDESDITARSRLFEDLGAESLDLVELMFLLEQEFSIRLSKADISLTAQLGLEEDEIHKNEVLTARALELLRERFPWAEELLVDGAMRKHLAALLTVSEIKRAVDNKLMQ